MNIFALVIGAIILIASIIEAINGSNTKRPQTMKSFEEQWMEGFQDPNHPDHTLRNLQMLDWIDESFGDDDSDWE